MNQLENEDIKKIAELNYNWAQLKEKTVLVSGGTGFIGSFLIDVIKYRNSKFGDGIKVISFSRSVEKTDGFIDYVKHDITKEIVFEKSVDYIIHLASNTHPQQYAADPIGTITTNVFGCNNLLKFAVKNKIKRFLLASSVEIYGEGNGSAIKEGDCGYVDSNTVRAGYNESKRVSESLCQAYIAQYGLDCVVARLARCFGADRKHDSKALAQFISKAVAGEDIVLKSKGEQRFSYCYVADAVSGILKILLDGKCGEAYNVSGEDEGKSLGDYARLIAAFIGKKVILDCNAQIGASKTDYAVMNCDKLKALDWKPLYLPSEALLRTIEIYKLRKE